MTEPFSQANISKALAHLEHNSTAQDRAALQRLKSDVSQHRQTTKTPAPPIRIIHHFACAGGTLISRYIAATPNARVLSEIDPLSPLTTTMFAPLDLSLQYKNSGLPPPRKDLEELFLHSLDALYQKLTSRGERLILRDHSHSHFCVGDRVPDRPTLRDMITAQFPCLSVLSVRHPLDSYLSLQKNGFIQFAPAGLEEYARRYLRFLETYQSTDMIKYEDFVTDHEVTFKHLCSVLDLTYPSNVSTILPALKMTGDSGRRGKELALRPRREISAAVAEMRATSPSYTALCERLDYAP